MGFGCIFIFCNVETEHVPHCFVISSSSLKSINRLFLSANLVTLNKKQQLNKKAWQSIIQCSGYVIYIYIRIRMFMAFAWSNVWEMGCYMFYSYALNKENLLHFVCAKCFHSFRKSYNSICIAPMCMMIRVLLLAMFNNFPSIVHHKHFSLLL